MVSRNQIKQPVIFQITSDIRYAAIKNAENSGYEGAFPASQLKDPKIISQRQDIFLVRLNAFGQKYFLERTNNPLTDDVFEITMDKSDFNADDETILQVINLIAAEGIISVEDSISGTVLLSGNDITDAAIPDNGNGFLTLYYSDAAKDRVDIVENFVKRFTGLPNNHNLELKLDGNAVCRISLNDIQIDNRSIAIGTFNKNDELMSMKLSTASTASAASTGFTSSTVAADSTASTASIASIAPNTSTAPMASTASTALSAPTASTASMALSASNLAVTATTHLVSAESNGINIERVRLIARLMYAIIMSGPLPCECYCIVDEQNWLTLPSPAQTTMPSDEQSQLSSATPIPGSTSGQSDETGRITTPSPAPKPTPTDGQTQTEGQSRITTAPPTPKPTPVIEEWRVEGYEAAAPYKEYERKYVNGESTDETRYTGKTKPEVKQPITKSYTTEPATTTKTESTTKSGSENMEPPSIFIEPPSIFIDFDYR